MDLMEYSEEIKSKEDFVKFIQAFNLDFIQNKNKWENNDLGSFLSAMEGFLTDSTKESLEIVDFMPSWKLFAKILITSSLYE